MHSFTMYNKKNMKGEWEAMQQWHIMYNNKRRQFGVKEVFIMNKNKLQKETIRMQLSFHDSAK